MTLEPCGSGPGPRQGREAQMSPQRANKGTMARKRAPLTPLRPGHLLPQPPPASPPRPELLPASGRGGVEGQGWESPPCHPIVPAPKQPGTALLGPAAPPRKRRPLAAEQEAAAAGSGAGAGRPAGRLGSARLGVGRGAPIAPTRSQHAPG